MRATRAIPALLSAVFLAGCAGPIAEQAFEEVVSRHPAHLSTRAVITVDVTRISDSCGWGVPVMEMTDERDLLHLQAKKKGPDGMSEYRAEKNAVSIDGLPGLPL